MIHFCKSVGLLLDETGEETLVLSSVRNSSVRDDNEDRRSIHIHTERFNTEEA